MSDETLAGEGEETTPETFAEQASDEVLDPEVLRTERDTARAERDEYMAQRDEYKDIALRLQADFENYKKRVASMQSDEIERATGRIAEEILPVLDACEAAFGHGVEGIEPIWSALIGALQRQGLEALDLLNQPFDPALAEAVVHEDGDGGEPVVVEVLRTGYRWKGRVLRAAMVKVRG